MGVQGACERLWVWGQIGTDMPNHSLQHASAGEPSADLDLIHHLFIAYATTGLTTGQENMEGGWEQLKCSNAHAGWSSAACQCRWCSAFATLHHHVWWL